MNNVVVTALGNQTFDGGVAKIGMENGKVPYDAAMAEVARLREALAKALETIATDAPDVADKFKGEAIAAQIDTLEAAVKKAFEDGTPAAGYEAVLAPVPAIDEAIAKLVADAKAAQEIETARQKANADAYKADLDAIEALQGKLDAAAAEVAEKYPDFDATKDKEAAQAAIDAAKAAALAAYEKVAKEGNYENTVDTAKIEELIQALLDAAAMSGIDSIIIDAEAGNAAIFNLQGVKLAHPVQGQMHIVVDKAGKAYKVFIR